MSKHIPISRGNISKVTEALKGFGYTQGDACTYYPNEPSRISPDFDMSYSIMSDTIESITMSLYVINEGMLQDIRVKELLLEYLV